MPVETMILTVGQGSKLLALLDAPGNSLASQGEDENKDRDTMDVMTVAEGYLDA